MLLDGAEDFELAERMLAVEIPTGLHSDVVYPVEWGPVELECDGVGGET